MISNGVSDVEYHILIPGFPVSTSNIWRGTRTRNLTVHFENKKYSDSNVPVSDTAHANVHNYEAPLQAMDYEDAMLYVLGVVMVQQFILNKGLKEFCDRSKEATMKELTQIHDMDTYRSLDASTLTIEQRKRALSDLLFLVGKRSEDIKGRICVDGSKKRREPD